MHNLCPQCNDGVLVPLRSLNIKKCSSCAQEQPFLLKPNQAPLLNNNRR